MQNLVPGALNQNIEVKAEFETMKNGRYLLESESAEENASPDKPKSLEELIMYTFRITHRSMLEHMTFSQRRAFRNVCHEFREMDDKVPLTVNNVTLSVADNVVEIVAGEFKAQYKKVNGGCTVGSSGRSHFIKQGDVLNTAAFKLGTLLNHKKQTSILSLSILEGDISRGHQLKTILERTHLEQKLKVKKLSIDYLDLEQFDTVASLLKPDSLETMELVQTQPFHVTGLMKEINPSRFKNLKTFVTDLMVELEDLHVGLSLFDYLKAQTFEEVDAENVEKMIKMLLQKPTLQQIVIGAIPSGIAHGVYEKYASHQSLTYSGVYHFEYPDNPGNNLMMELKNDSIVFRGPKYDKENDIIIRERNPLPRLFRRLFPRFSV